MPDYRAVRSEAWAPEGQRPLRKPVGRRLERRVRAADAVLLVLTDDGVRFEDSHGKRLAEIASKGWRHGIFDTTREIVWLTGGRRLAAIDLLDPAPHVNVLAESLAHERVAFQYRVGSVIAPAVPLDGDPLGPGSAFTLLAWSSTEVELADVAIAKDGHAKARRRSADFDRRWLVERANRIGWWATGPISMHDHDACPKPPGDRDCQPFGSSTLWLFSTRVGDVESVLYDADRERWAAPRHDLAPTELQWSTQEPPAAAFGASFDIGGRVYTTRTHVCRIDGRCRPLGGAPLGFLYGDVPLGASP